MDIGVPIKELGCYDIEPLKNKILSLPEEAWWGNQFRQLEYEVHQHTQSIVLVFTDGQGWPNIEVAKDVGWDLLAEEALPLMHQILEDHYPRGGTIIRARPPINHKSDSGICVNGNMYPMTIMK